MEIKTMEFIHIRVPLKVRQDFKAVAAKKGKSMTELAGDLIAQYLIEIEKEVA